VNGIFKGRYFFTGRAGRGTVFLAALTAAVLGLTACAGGPEGPPRESRPASPEQVPEAGPFTVEPREFPFSEIPPETLPPEARSYLSALAGAFRGRDRDFLLSQGETQFEAEVRPGYDEESYLALLYRIGPYGEDGLWDSTSIPRLVPDEILGIEYLDWKELGPLLEIRGRLIRREGTPLPCLIMLAWRLREPKIQGRFP
jgi:hypothetical protein